MTIATLESRRTPKAYGPYSRGVERTQTGRQAKADYMRARRAEARKARDRARAQGVPYIVDGIKHGYSGYVNHLCECPTCKTAKQDRDSRRDRRAA